MRPIIDFYDADFFELMGLVYANARRFRCALRWYRELIRDLETKKPESRSDNESVYASVGYCFYSLRLFEEAIAWSKACIGPRPTADARSRALIDYEAQLRGGAIRKVERVASRTRYLVSTFDFEPAHASQSTARLKAAIQGFAPFQETYIDWVTHETGTDVASRPGMQPCDYPFEGEIDGSSLVRHKLNLIFATCGLADALVERGYVLEAKRLLSEAALIEPEAGIGFNSATDSLRGFRFVWHDHRR